MTLGAWGNICQKVKRIKYRLVDVGIITAVAAPINIQGTSVLQPKFAIPNFNNICIHCQLIQYHCHCHGWPILQLIVNLFEY